ncbi:acetyltransferase [Christiangramia aquimixticola]|uniref:acetyltransferase n=1 Tax=Christiangramia aquimixticola TaxID=1697558 RepID=UPI003AA9B49C
MSDKIQILGLSEYYPAVILDILTDLGYEDFTFFPNLEVSFSPYFPLKDYAYQIMGIEGKLDKKMAIVFGVSNPKNKYAVFKHFQKLHSLALENLSTFIHNSSYFPYSSKMGKGVIIEQNCTLSSQTLLGDAISIKRGVTIGHHCKIGSWVDINPGVTISGKVNIGVGTMIGSGATLIDGISIGNNTIIGAGSVVTKDIPSGVIAYGNPCKVIKYNDRWNLPIE